MKASKDDSLYLPLIISKWLNLERHPRAIIDKEFHLIWCTKDFIEDSYTLGLLLIDGHIVKFSNQDYQRQLASFIESSCNYRTWSVVDSVEENSPIVLQSTRISISSGDSYFGLRLIGSGRKSLINDVGYVEFFKLTAKESQILNGFVKGHSVSDISIRMRLSKETVRFHVRNIYEKMGVSSREQLFSLLFRFTYP